MLVLLPKRDNRRKLRHSVDLGISVRSTHRARGLGRLVLTHAINWARSIPELQIITLEVYASNTNAFTLYQSLGFVESGRQPKGLIHDDNTTHEQVAMWLNLKQTHITPPHSIQPD
jgi:ribosomal protein S18 acetylase RimI-like enzyme